MTLVTPIWLIAGLIGVAQPAPAPCEADLGQVDIYKLLIKAELSIRADSAANSLDGLPFKPSMSAIQFVTDTTVCAQALVAYNNGFAPPRALHSVLVCMVAPSRHVVVSSADKVPVLMVFDARWVILFSFAG